MPSSDGSGVGIFTVRDSLSGWTVGQIEKRGMYFVVATCGVRDNAQAIADTLNDIGYTSSDGFLKAAE